MAPPAPVVPPAVSAAPPVGPSCAGPAPPATPAATGAAACDGPADSTWLPCPPLAATTAAWSIRVPQAAVRQTDRASNADTWRCRRRRPLAVIPASSAHWVYDL